MAGCSRHIDPTVLLGFIFLFISHLKIAMALAPSPAVMPVIDVVFIAEGFSNEEEMDQFRAFARSFEEYLLNYEPFKSRAEHFRFGTIENTKPLGCARSGRIVVCDPIRVRGVVRAARKQADRTVVILNTQEYGGSGGETAVTYIGKQAHQMFVHEFGHVFAGLLDEYVSVDSPGPIDGRHHSNCFAGSAPPAPGWVQGCMYPNWYRSQEDSIMSRLHHEYFNDVSQAIINQTIDSMLAAKAFGNGRRGD